MGGTIQQPTSFGMGTNQSNSGSGWDITGPAPWEMPGTQPQMNIDPSLTTTIQQPGSSFANMFSQGSFGNGGFMSNLPGYALGALSYFDQKKTNKLNREATRYALDRKKTEDTAYDKYKNQWSGMSFA